MSATPMPQRLTVGARTLASIQRAMVRVTLTLAEALDGHLPVLPNLPREAHGYLVTSLPEDRREALTLARSGMIAVTRHRYIRHWVDLTSGFAAYRERLTPNLRANLDRATGKIACVSGGALDIRRFHAPAEMSVFHDVARRISLRTYRERALGGGMPDDPAFLRLMYAAAAAGLARGWLLYIAGEPAAYLYCAIESGTAVHDQAGHDPAFADFAPAGVLQLEALRDLFGERGPKRFDFKFGDSRHKRPFATCGVPCIDLMLLRPSLAHRAATAALGTVDRAATIGKRGVARLGLERIARSVRR